MPTAEHFDVVVVGAGKHSQESIAIGIDLLIPNPGFAALAAAKAYLQCGPDTNLIMLDDNRSIGGVWAKEKIYEGLRSNNLRGTFELPDFPMGDRYGVKHDEHIPGLVLHQYLCDYAEHFGLTSRIRLETNVVEAEKREDGWSLAIEKGGVASTITTSNLIVGSGLTSKPAAMHINGEESYDAPFISAAHLATEAPAILEDPTIATVTIFGGSKFAYDSVYKFASAGKKVDWVIRKSGHGPTWTSVPYQKIPGLGACWLERLVATRAIAWMSPCYWGGLDGSAWWRWFLHQTWFGRLIVSGFWAKMGAETLSQSGFTNHPNLKALHPDCSIFETATSLAVLNFPTDILDYVRSGQVRVHRQDTTHLSSHAVHLKNGTVLRSDALVASTGWLWGANITFKDTHLHADLGLPSTDYTTDQKAFWAALDAKADKEVFFNFPMLKTLKYPPRAAEEDMKADPLSPDAASRPQYSPIRLYRGIAPPGLAAKGDRSLAFTGFSANVTHTIKSEITGVWIYAYFHDQLAVDPVRDVEDIYYETARFQRFCFRRHPYGFGRRFPDFVFDAIPWNDVLLRDLGVQWLRKGGSWWREAFEPYTTAEYRGVTEEWLAKRKGGKMNGVNGRADTKKLV